MVAFSAAPPSYEESQKNNKCSTSGDIYTLTVFFKKKDLNTSQLISFNPDERLYVAFYSPPLGSFLTPPSTDDHPEDLDLPESNVVSICYESSDYESLVTIRDSVHFNHLNENARKFHGIQHICYSMVKYYTKDGIKGNIHFQITVERLMVSTCRDFHYFKNHFTASSSYSMVVKYSKGCVKYKRECKFPTHSFFFSAPPLSISVLHNSEVLEYAKISRATPGATFAVVYRSCNIEALEELKNLLTNFNSFMKEPLELKDILLFHVEVDPIGDAKGNPLDAAEIHLDAESLRHYWSVNLSFNCNAVLPCCDGIVLWS